MCMLLLHMPIETTDCGKLFVANTAMCHSGVNFVVISQRPRRGKNLATSRTRKILLDRGRRIK